MTERCSELHKKKKTLLKQQGERNTRGIQNTESQKHGVKTAILQNDDKKMKYWADHLPCQKRSAQKQTNKKEENSEIPA